MRYNLQHGELLQHQNGSPYRKSRRAQQTEKLPGLLSQSEKLEPFSHVARPFSGQLL